MKKIVVLTIMLALSAGLSFGKEHRTAIAIMNITATSGITLAEATQLTKKLLNELVLRDAYDIVDIDKRDEVLKEQGFQQTGACDAASCLVEAGKLLGVKKIIGGCIGKIGSVYSVEFQMVDVLTGKVEKVYSSQCSGDASRLLELMKESSHAFSGINAPVVNVPSNLSLVQEAPLISMKTPIINEVNPDITNNSPVDLSKGLVAYYPFNGNSNDESGHQNDGNNQGAIFVQDRFGNPNQAALFNGVDSYVRLTRQVGDALNNNDFTVSAWINADELDGQDASVLGCDNPANSRCLTLLVRYHKPLLAFYSNDTWGLSQLREQNWYHLVYRYNKNKAEQAIFVNGVFDNAEKGHGPLINDGQIPAIGRWAGGRNFRGIIDDVRIYQRPLTNDEIKALYYKK